MALATPILTNISTKGQIFFAESPMHFNFMNEAQDATIESVTVEVYIWRGSQMADLPSSPVIVFNNVKKISPHDNYIHLDIHNEVKAFITSSNLNKNNPQWAYNATKDPTTAGEGVYFHIVYKVDEETDKQLGSFFATSGYRYSYEQKGGYYITYDNQETYRRYAEGIRYSVFAVSLSTVYTSSQSGSGRGANKMIGVVWIEEPTEVQTGVKCVIAYINKSGLWDMFTPFGKFVEEIPTERDEYPTNFRDPLNVNSQIQHLKQNGAPKGFRKFQINTGLLDERNNYQIQELKQSSKLYLVIFTGEVYTEEQEGITVDSTTVTVDDTTITVDSDTVTSENVGYYSAFTQIPVRNVNGNFLKKTRLNDKSSISYTLELEETNNYINDIM